MEPETKEVKKKKTDKKVLFITGVPLEMHKELKIAAVREEKKLNEFILEILKKELDGRKAC